MGFSEEKAETVWNLWCDFPNKPPLPADGLETKEMQKVWWDFCTRELDTDEKEPSGDSDEEWRRSLDAYGIKQQLKDAIMDPEFSYLRLSQSCRHWIKDTMDIHYKSAQRRMFDSERASSTQIFAKPTEGKKFSDGIEYRPRYPGFFPVYMAVDEDRIHHVFDGEGNLDNLDQLRTTHPSDFSGSPGCFYFTPQFKLAELHARYANRRAPTASIAVLSVCVSWEELMRLSDIGKACSLSGPDWVGYVWVCRNGLTPSPTGLFSKYGKATMLHGWVPRNLDSWREYARMVVENEFTSNNVHMLNQPNGSSDWKARQWMFSASEGAQFLKEHAKFRVLKYEDL